MSIRLDCREVSRLLSARQDGRLAAPDQARLRLHLVMCQACRNVDEQMAFIRTAMRRLAEGGGPAGGDGAGEPPGDGSR